MSNWDDMPDEVKEMIVQRCTEKTRIALKSTSSFNQKIVQNTHLKSINYLKIRQDEDGSFNISIRHRTVFLTFSGRNFDQCTNYPSFKEFKEALTDLLKKVDCIKKLEIQGVKHDIPLERWSNGFRERLRAEIVIIAKEHEMNLTNIFAQIEPVYLRLIEIEYDRGNSAIYDMPQIVLAEDVHAGTALQENQLLNLNARKFRVNRGLSFSFLKFIEKCIYSADPRIMHFKLCGLYVRQLKILYALESDKVTLDTLHPQLKLELSFMNLKVEGTIRYASESVASEFLYRDPSVLRYISQFDINFISDGCWEIVITRRNHASYKYASLQSIGEVQRKFDEIVETVDCIEKLGVNLQETEESKLDGNVANRKIRWTPRAKKIVIQFLEVYGDHSTTSIYDLLNQIEPAYMINMRIESKERDDIIFDMPHAQAVSHIIFEGMTMKPEHLLGLNANVIINNIVDGEQTDCEALTGAVINQYLKKCLASLNEKFHIFRLCNLNATVTEEEVFEGITILGSNQFPSSTKNIVADSENDKYVLEVSYSRESMLGFRSEREPAT